MCNYLLTILPEWCKQTAVNFQNVVLCTGNSVMSAGRMQQPLEFQKGKVLLISFSHFIHDIYSSFLAPLLPFIIEKFSLSLTQAGFLSTVMQIPALLNPYIGKLADRISVRYFIILAPLLTAVPMSLLSVAPHYGVLLILLFSAGNQCVFISCTGAGYGL